MKKTELEVKIEEANKAYREGKPLMSDWEYDALIDRLKIEQPQSSLFKSGIIGIYVNETRKEKLPVQMRSLEPVKSKDELKKWCKSRNLSDSDILVLSLKLDGISLLVHEEQGACWTSGDGEYGQISDKWFGRTNSSAVFGEDFYTWGEAIMSKKNFEEHFKANFSNARNMVAGLFNNKEPNNNLIFVDYIRYGCNLPIDKFEQIELLNSINHVQLEFMTFRVDQIDVMNFDAIFKEWSKNYNIDGLVIDINEYELREVLGYEKNGNPAFAVKFKNPEWSSSGITKVIGITWKVSKQGKLKPVVQVEPIEVAGVIIRNVTGYNAKFIQTYDIKEGGIVVISRKGDVIPGIIKVEDVWVK